MTAYTTGYRLALRPDSHDVDHYLARRSPTAAAEFERGWFDALEDRSDYDTAAMQTYLANPTGWRK